MIASLTCLTSANTSVGFGARQKVVLDLSDVGCINTAICIQAGGGGVTVNVIGDTFLQGQITVALNANDHAVVRPGGGARFVGDNYLALPYLIIASNAGSVELPGPFNGMPVFVNMGGLASYSKCIPSNAGFIIANGSAPPCQLSMQGGQYFQ
jgi:hypothetical protein